MGMFMMKESTVPVDARARVKAALVRIFDIDGLL